MNTTYALGLGLWAYEEIRIDSELKALQQARPLSSPLLVEGFPVDKYQSSTSYTSSQACTLSSFVLSALIVI